MIYRSKCLFILFLFLILENQAFLSQSSDENDAERVKKTFNASRIINGHSNEVLEKNVLEFRVEHKFGDMFGDVGGVQQFYGLDNSSDIRIAFEYGITDYAMIGLGRNKGAGPYRGLVDGFVKSRMFSQTEDGSIPLSLTFLGSGTLTYARASADLTAITSYPEFKHRLAYASQFILTTKIKNRLSLALLPTYVHRNFVRFDDQNSLFSLGGAFNYRFSDKFGFMMEYYYNFDRENLRSEFFNSLSCAFEWKTFGHVFSIYLSNARGFTEQQFIPYTSANWLEGQFRLGFAIVRKFEF